MNSEPHHEYLRKEALRVAQRVSERNRRTLTLGEFCALRVQTVEPWKRVLCVLVGAVFGMAAFWFSSGDKPNGWVAVIFGVLGLASFVVGMVGWKRPVEVVLQATAEAVFNQILDLL